MLESKEFEVPLKGVFYLGLCQTIGLMIVTNLRTVYLSGCLLLTHFIFFFSFSFFSISHGGKVSSDFGVEFMTNMTQGVRLTSLKG